MQTLQLGSKNDDVKIWQQGLNKLGFDCGAADGIFGKNTDKQTRLWQKSVKIINDGIVRQKDWDEMVAALAKLECGTKNYQDLDWTPVINWETGGKNYYNKYLKNVTWPGGASGNTLGAGADLGYLTVSEFDAYFSKFFTEEQNKRLKSVIGLKGIAAKNKLSTVKDIQLSWEDASEIFKNWTLPKFWKLANDIWPGLDQLCDNAKVALTSIVFNRGSSLSGDSRREMKNIIDLVKNKNYDEIANQIISMKRLWVGKGLDGLLTRRDEEAKMVKMCVNGK